MVLIGFLVRVLYILLAHSYKFRTTDANFSFGWEIGRIAYSLSSGHGFSSPFGGDTGPSAWTAPVYPFIVSIAFRVFGAYTLAASFALLTFNSLCAALTCWPVYRIARRIFGEFVAVWSGWVWALLPYIIYWSVRQVWETSLTALLLSLAFMLTIEMEGDSRLTSWMGFGVLWGVIGLTNPSCLSFLPFSGCWLAYQLIRRSRPFLLPASRRCSHVLDDHAPMARPQLRGVSQTRLRARQRRSRGPLRQQPAGRRHLGRHVSSQPEPDLVSSGIGRWAKPPTPSSRPNSPNNGSRTTRNSTP